MRNMILIHATYPTNLDDSNCLQMSWISNEISLELKKNWNSHLDLTGIRTLAPSDSEVRLLSKMCASLTTSHTFSTARLFSTIENNYYEKQKKIKESEMEPDFLKISHLAQICPKIGFFGLERWSNVQVVASLLNILHIL